MNYSLGLLCKQNPARNEERAEVYNLGHDVSELVLGSNKYNLNESVLN